MLSPLNKQKPPAQRHRLLRFSTLFILVVAIGAAILYRQDVLDWWKLHNYDPPIQISRLATQDTMTDYARKVFYVNQPDVEVKASFASVCPSGDKKEQTIVLGCYHSDQNGIYILKVSDVRLDGVQQVTAAHEMLHAAYDRLSSAERDDVDAMLQDYYSNGLTDKRIISTIDAYKKTEPNDLVNEMHSIFATEIAVLPVNLENYYKKYFDNRARVAAFAADYQSEFTSRQDIVARDDARLGAMKAQIDTLNDDIKSKQATISSKESELKLLRRTDIRAYNAAVPVFNALINDYNVEIDQLKGLINAYNQLVSARNAVALEADQLSKELSSDVRPINN